MFDISSSDSIEVQYLKHEYNISLAYESKSIKDALDYLIEYMVQDWIKLTEEERKSAVIYSDYLRRTIPPTPLYV